MNLAELRRVIREELAEGRDLKRTDDDIAGRILDLMRQRVCLPVDERQGAIDA